ncbi:MAG: N-acetyl-gamma-glutamyl-phosphate reductase [Candidatus Tokpelaia sp. JSC161]|jgi:N-acetyl-gamma-glutamyl-phosphate reductase|nr:MAG: N-acetyl-gamma-glutamyl-phosphate reductase [Candidatus Tokpelaia sp. JSC161]
MVKIFIDGEYGTTGLQIQQRLSKKNNLDILSIPKADRYNTNLRIDYLRSSDITILCLPDHIARKTIDTIEQLKGCQTRIIDTSTAHRTEKNWTYGFPELTKNQNIRISAAKRVSNPGCYPTGAISLIRPLRESGIIEADYPLTINAVSGYTGGGKKLIATMELESHPHYFLYALRLNHKHIKEIMIHSQLYQTPIFTPAVSAFPQGMIISIPLHMKLMKKKVNLTIIHEILQKHYDGTNLIEVASIHEILSKKEIHAEELSHTDKMKIYITGSRNGELANLIAVLDNLGKGAAGAAIQNLNLMLENKYQ